MFFIQMSGVPGSGKSTFAKAISQKLDCVVVDHDVTKTALLEVLSNELADKLMGQASYQIDWSFIESLIIQKKNVLFDSPCLYEEIIERGMTLAKKYNLSYKYIECINEDYDSVSERLKERNQKISQITKFQSQEKFVEALNGSKRPPSNNFFIVDTSKPIDTYLEEVFQYIKED